MTFLSSTWKSPYLRKTVLILRPGPGGLFLSEVGATHLKIGTRRWNLQDTDFQMSCWDFTISQGTRIVVPGMATRWCLTCVSRCLASSWAAASAKFGRFWYTSISFSTPGGTNKREITLDISSQGIVIVIPGYLSHQLWCCPPYRMRHGQHLIGPWQISI